MPKKVTIKISREWWKGKNRKGYFNVARGIDGRFVAKTQKWTKLDSIEKYKIYVKRTVEKRMKVKKPKKVVELPPKKPVKEGLFRTIFNYGMVRLHVVLYEEEREHLPPYRRLGRYKQRTYICEIKFENCDLFIDLRNIKSYNDLRKKMMEELEKIVVSKVKEYSQLYFDAPIERLTDGNKSTSYGEIVYMREDVKGTYTAFDNVDTYLVKIKSYDDGYLEIV